jgi:hypothetical protein
MKTILETEAPKHNFENKEEAESNKHELVEVEVAGVSLGSKYYENENENKPVLLDAEDKNSSENNKPEATAKFSVSSSDRKNEKVEIKKEKVEAKFNTGMFLLLILFSNIFLIKL